MPERKPYVGATVLFAPREWQASMAGTTAPRAAIVCDVYPDGTLSLVVFAPGASSYPLWETFVRHDPAGAPGTWRWPAPPET